MNGFTKIVIICSQPFSGSMCDPSMLSALDFWGSGIGEIFFANSSWNINSFIFPLLLWQGLIITKFKHCFSCFVFREQISSSELCMYCHRIYLKEGTPVSSDITRLFFVSFKVHFYFCSLRDARRQDKNIHSRNIFYISANHLWIRCTSESLTRFLYVE